MNNYNNNNNKNSQATEPMYPNNNNRRESRLLPGTLTKQEIEIGKSQFHYYERLYSDIHYYNNDKKTGIFKKPNPINLLSNYKEHSTLRNQGIVLISFITTTDELDANYVRYSCIVPNTIPNLEDGKFELKKELEELYDNNYLHRLPPGMRLVDFVIRDPDELPLFRVDPKIIKVSLDTDHDEIRHLQLRPYNNILEDEIIKQDYNRRIIFDNISIAQYENDSRIIPFYRKDNGIVAGFVSEGGREDIENNNVYTLIDINDYIFVNIETTFDKKDEIIFNYEEPKTRLSSNNLALLNRKRKINETFMKGKEVGSIFTYLSQRSSNPYIRPIVSKKVRRNGVPGPSSVSGGSNIRYINNIDLSNS